MFSLCFMMYTNIIVWTNFILPPPPQATPMIWMLRAKKSVCNIDNVGSAGDEAN